MNSNNNMPRRPLPQVMNPELEAQIETYKKSLSVPDLDRILVLCRKAVILLLAAPGSDQKPAPVVLNGSDGKQYLSVFTSKEHLDKSPQIKGAVIMPFMSVLNLVKASNNKLNGIVINAFSQNIRLDSVLLSIMDHGTTVAETQAAKAAGSADAAPGGTTAKKVVLTDEQINQLERMQFETQFLAKKFYDGGMDFIRELVREKEERIDTLFEESYKNKRMYPYLTEEFNVFSVAPDDNTVLVRIGMPERGLESGCAYRIYMIADEKEMHYFLIVTGKDNKPQMVRVGRDLKPAIVGPAPDETQEIFTIMHMVAPEATI